MEEHFHIDFNFCFRGGRIQRQASAVQCYGITLGNVGKDKIGEKQVSYLQGLFMKEHEANAHDIFLNQHYVLSMTLFSNTSVVKYEL